MLILDFFKSKKLLYHKFRIYFFIVMAIFCIIDFGDNPRNPKFSELLLNIFLGIISLPGIIIFLLHLDLFLVFFVDVKNFIDGLKKGIIEIYILIYLLIYLIYSAYVFSFIFNDDWQNFNEQNIGPLSIITNPYLFAIESLKTMQISYLKDSYRFIISNLTILFLIFYYIRIRIEKRHENRIN